MPAKVPYISANPEKVAPIGKRNWRGAAANSRSGLVWEGGPFQPENYLRSASLAAYAPLGEVPGVAFFALQKGTAEAQSKNPPPGMDFTDLGPFIKDFSDTAAILDNLDLLISIDTSVVHVAGALAKPVFMMLAYSPGHMWMFHRSGHAVVSDVPHLPPAGISGLGDAGGAGEGGVGKASARQSRLKVIDEQANGGRPNMQTSSQRSNIGRTLPARADDSI